MSDFFNRPSIVTFALGSTVYSHNTFRTDDRPTTTDDGRVTIA